MRPESQMMSSYASAAARRRERDPRMIDEDCYELLSVCERGSIGPAFSLLLFFPRLLWHTHNIHTYTYTDTDTRNTVFSSTARTRQREKKQKRRHSPCSIISTSKANYFPNE